MTCKDCDGLGAYPVSNGKTWGTETCETCEGQGRVCPACKESIPLIAPRDAGLCADCFFGGNWEGGDMTQRKIGGSDISKLIGASPWGGPIDVYRRIVEGHKVEQTKAMRRGHLLEPVCRQMYLDETGAELGPKQEIIQSVKYEFMTASIDDLATRDGQKLVVEYKSANISTHKQWGEPGTDQVPQQYLAQVAWYLAATDLPAGDLAVLIGGDEFRVYRITRDLELEAMMLEAAERFWIDHVLTKTPPPPDSSEGYGEWLKEKYPSSGGDIIVAPSLDKWAAQLREAKALVSRGEELEREARNNIVSEIGSHDGARGNGWKITYKETKGRASVDWDGVCAELKIPDAVVEKHTRRTPYRVFRPTFDGEAK